MFFIFETVTKDGGNPPFAFEDTSMARYLHEVSSYKKSKVYTVKEILELCLNKSGQVQNWELLEAKIQHTKEVVYDNISQNSGIMAFKVGGKYFTYFVDFQKNEARIQGTPEFWQVRIGKDSHFTFYREPIYDYIDQGYIFDPYLEWLEISHILAMEPNLADEVVIRYMLAKADAEKKGRGTRRYKKKPTAEKLLSLKPPA